MVDALAAVRCGGTWWKLGFNAPEIRGDRFWTILAAGDEVIDVVGIAEIIGRLLS